MDSLFQYDDENIESVDPIDLDELYERKQEQDKSKLFTYNKILNRIHARIKLTSRQKTNQHFCWFVVPEIILGAANYDHAGCIAYLVDKLQENKFLVKYTHPNLLLISWQHYVPNYVRSEFKKKTGMIMDERGNALTPEQAAAENAGGHNKKHLVTLAPQAPQDLNALLYNPKIDGSAAASGGPPAEKKTYTPINQYRPTGSLVYNDDLFQRIETRTGQR